MHFQQTRFAAIRYRGFLLLKQPNESWLVRPERSPMTILPFRTSIGSISEVKNLVDEKLNEINTYKKVA